MDENEIHGIRCSQPDWIGLVLIHTYSDVAENASIDKISIATRSSTGFKLIGNLRVKERRGQAAQRPQQRIVTPLDLIPALLCCRPIHPSLNPLSSSTSMNPTMRLES